MKTSPSIGRLRAMCRQLRQAVMEDGPATYDPEWVNPEHDLVQRLDGLDEGSLMILTTLIDDQLFPDHQSVA